MKGLICTMAACLLFTASTAVGGFYFLVDDGTGETSIGVNNGTTGSPFTWANRFTNDTGLVLTLVDIEVAFGRLGGSGVGALAVGDAMDAAIFIDPAGSGNMVNATLDTTWALAGGVHAIDGQTFASHTVPGTVVVPIGADFYVGIIDRQSGIDSLMRFPAAEDTTPPSAGRSWALFGGDLLDPSDPLNTIGTIDSFGLPGNWLVRANAVPAPGALALLGLAGLVSRRRR